VLGDGGKLYVPPELVGAYREALVPLAAVVTPNQFEAELLTGKPVQTIDDAVRHQSNARHPLLAFLHSSRTLHC
jgi:pyridoxine kinase